MVRIAAALGSKSLKILLRRYFALLATALSHVERLHGKNRETTNDNKLVFPKFSRLTGI